MAVDAKTGRTRWSKALPSRAESSPLLASGRLYFGTEDGTVYAMRARDGAVRWKARASGAVKGGLALSRGRLIFGDYGGKVHAISRADGHELWESSSAGTKLGPERRAASTGRRRSRTVASTSAASTASSTPSAPRTGGWPGATRPAATSTPHPRSPPSRASVPTVYVGSFDGHLYAFDARTGSVRWRHDAGGRISGGPVVFGDLVFFSNLGRKSTTALGAATGKRVWATRRGAFNPAISDGRRIYLNGYSSLFMLSSRRQARIDERARRRLGRAAATPRRQAERRAAARARSRRRAIDRRVATRRAAVHRAIRLRRAGREVCFTRDGQQGLPRPSPGGLLQARRGRPAPDGLPGAAAVASHAAPRPPTRRAGRPYAGSVAGRARGAGRAGGRTGAAAGARAGAATGRGAGGGGPTRVIGSATRGSGIRLGRSSRTGFSSNPGRDSAPKRSASSAKSPKPSGGNEDREHRVHATATIRRPRPGLNRSAQILTGTPAAARCALASATR